MATADSRLSTGTHRIRVTLLEDPQNLINASTTGILQLAGVQISVWNLLALLGLKDGLTTNDHTNCAIVVVNCLPAPLALSQKLYVDAGTHIGYPATMNASNDLIVGSEEIIPGVRPHPTKAGATLTGVGAYTIGGSFWDTWGAALSFSFKADNSGPWPAVAVKLGALWLHPAASVTDDVSKHSGQDPLTAFHGDAGNNQLSASGAEVAITAMYEKISGPKGFVPGNCLIVCVKPV
jgi:hypothetical protein